MFGIVKFFFFDIKVDRIIFIVLVKFEKFFEELMKFVKFLVFEGSRGNILLKN